MSEPDVPTNAEIDPNVSIDAPEIGDAAARRAAVIASVKAKRDSANGESHRDNASGEDARIIPVAHDSNNNDRIVEGYAIPASEVAAPPSPTTESKTQRGGLLGKLLRKDPNAAPTAAARNREDNERRARLRLEAEAEGHRRQSMNLLNMSKIAIKTMIEGTIGLAPPITDSHRPLAQLLLVLEHLLRHGVRKKALAAHRDLFALFDSLERAGQLGEVTGLSGETPFATVVKTARGLAGLKSNRGRGRYCLRMALQQAALSEVLRLACEQEALLLDIYEPWAFMASEDAPVLSGLLMGLATLQLELSREPELLDSDTDELDLSLYFKDGNYLKQATAEDPQETTGRFSEESFTALSDQNAQLREVNRRLEQQVADVQASMQQLEADTAAAQEQAQAREAECEALRNATAAAEAQAKEAREACDQRLQSVTADLDVERATYNTSREGLTQVLDATQQQMEKEQGLREQVEAELEALKRQHHETQQEVLAAQQQLAQRQELNDKLRKQLKDVKGLNLQMLSTVQELQSQVKEGEQKAHQLEQEKTELQSEIQSLNAKTREHIGGKERLEKTLVQVTSRLKDVDGQRTELDTKLMMEVEWRESLQKELEAEQQSNAELSLFKDQFHTLQSDHQQLQAKHQLLQTEYRQQEQALLELGQRLSENALKVDTLEAQRKSQRTKQWQDDTEVMECSMCQRSFGVKRRKHHCRQCGGVFCAECSDQKVKLPSSAKPVRVCDRCHEEFLKL
eukprot:TRINITY_DN11920_c1_g1_i6.p1 TRINITY_DN11920_c1_g1~~TRINITY_DN11920_c1_g1_i6.p1  ORF type:complete len:742 (+),score=243.10 TRINITY_DN11920_c1_g1_i6:109-2334(+)